MSCQSSAESDECVKEIPSVVDKVKRNDNKGFVDFITKIDDKIEIIRCKITDVDNIHIILSHRCKNLGTLVCLDFHGVADLYGPDEPIPSELPKCIISYIGSNMMTLQSTIDMITPRILSNEIIFGVIVYTKHSEPQIGTKGWILSLMATIVRKIHFIDDDMVNIQCANNIKNKAIKSYFITKAPSRAKLEKQKPNQQHKPLPKQAVEEILIKIGKGNN